MKLHLLATRLIAIVLFLSGTACSKKGEAMLTSATGSYKLDGITKKCKVTAYVREAASNTQLTVALSTVPEPQNGPEALQLFYTKLPGQPNTAYKMVSTTLAGYNGSYATVTTSYATSPLLLTVTNSSLCSGTFGGASLSFGNNSVISDGEFSNVQL